MAELLRLAAKRLQFAPHLTVNNITARGKIYEGYSVAKMAGRRRTAEFRPGRSEAYCDRIELALRLPDRVASETANFVQIVKKSWTCLG